MASEDTGVHVVTVFRTWLIDTKYIVTDKFPDNWDNMTNSSRETWIKIHGKPLDPKFREVVAVEDGSFASISESYVPD